MHASCSIRGMDQAQRSAIRGLLDYAYATGTRDERVRYAAASGIPVTQIGALSGLARSTISRILGRPEHEHRPAAERDQDRRR